MRRVLIAMLMVAVVGTTALPTMAQEEATCEGLVLLGVWSRPALAMDGSGNGAAFLVIVNPGTEDDTLISGSSDVASVVEIHETSMTEDGVMQMRQVEGGIPIPAGGAVTLRPGGYHVMFIGLNQDLVLDEAFEVTLTFENAGNVTLNPVPAFEAPQDDAISFTTVGDVSGCPTLGMYGAWTETGEGYLDVYGVLLNLSQDNVELVGADSTLTESAQLMGIYEGIDPMEVESITVPAEGAVMLNSDHLFIRLSELAEMPAPGDTFELNLSLTDMDDLTAMVHVRMPMMTDSSMMGHGDSNE